MDYAVYEILTGFGIDEASTGYALYNSNLNSIYGKGFVSEFLAIGESFVDLDTDELYKYKTDHRNLTIYDTLGADFNYQIL